MAVQYTTVPPRAEYIVQRAHELVRAQVRTGIHLGWSTAFKQAAAEYDSRYAR